MNVGDAHRGKACLMGCKLILKKTRPSQTCKGQCVSSVRAFCNDFVQLHSVALTTASFAKRSEGLTN